MIILFLILLFLILLHDHKKSSNANLENQGIFKKIFNEIIHYLQKNSEDPTD